MALTTTQPSLRTVKLVGGTVVVGAILAVIGYSFGFDTFGTWVQLVGQLIASLFTA